MLPEEDSPVARVRGIVPVNSQQLGIYDNPIDSFCNPPTAGRFFYGAPLNEGMAEVPYIIGERSAIVVAMDWTDFDADNRPPSCWHSSAIMVVQRR